LDTLSVVSFIPPTKGTVTKIGNILTYKPDLLSKGVFTFKYTISDGTTQVEATALFTEEPLQQQPKLQTFETDGYSDTITVTKTNPHSSATSFTDATTGAVTLSYAQSQPYKGADSFTFTVSDGLNNVTKTITFTLINKASVAKNYNSALQFADAAIGITLNVAAKSTDADAADVSFLTVTSILSALTNGAIVINVGKSIKYTLNANWAGSNSFKYILSHGIETSEGTVNVVSAAI
jgi:hypothetical protein